jgi:hypothetical protein
MEGVYSADLKEAIEDLDGLSEKEVTIRGETIRTFVVDGSVSCNLENETARETIDGVVDEYGTISGEEMDDLIESLDMHQQTKLADILPL